MSAIMFKFKCCCNSMAEDLLDAAVDFVAMSIGELLSTVGVGGKDN